MYIFIHVYIIIILTRTICILLVLFLWRTLIQARSPSVIGMTCEDTACPPNPEEPALMSKLLAQEREAR